MDIDKMRRNRKKGKTSVNIRRGRAKPKRIDIECLYDGDDVIYISFEKIEHSHKRAVLIDFGDDQKEWMPFSQISNIDVDDRVIICSEYIARQKGLEPNW